MQPVMTTREPSARASLRASTVSMDSWRASSMKAQVLTTTRSASSAAPAGTRPSASIVPVNLSESTWFFGQPSVSTQKVFAIGASLQEGCPIPVDGAMADIRGWSDAGRGDTVGPDEDFRILTVRGP